MKKIKNDKKLSKREWQLKPRTLEIHGGGSPLDEDLRSSVYRVIAFPLRSFERAARLFAGTEEGFIYTRINNPTVDRLERRLAVLEGGEAALATSSGMAAIMLVAEYFGQGGGNIVSSNRIYGGTFHLFRERLPKLGIKTLFVENPFDIKKWERAITARTKLLYVENPSNPSIDIFDIKEIATLAKARNIPLVVDSTLATPALLRPLEQGADVVIHSLSKYMGDGEVIGGIVLGKKLFIDDLRASWMRDTGPCMAPDNAAILSYHIESLFPRMAEHCQNAYAVARFLARHPKVKRVLYPSFGLLSRRNKKLMPQGFGGLMAFELKGGVRAARKVLEGLKLFWHAANIGEARSLVIHPATTTHGQLTSAERKKAGMTDGMLRLSVGREDPRDLIEDLKQALEKI